MNQHSETNRLLPVVLLLLIITAGVLFFTNLAWGDGYLFHPDERNIASAITNIDLDHAQFNPKFWAYGSLPIYIIYFIDWGLNTLFKLPALTFEYFLITGRFLSAISAIAVVSLSYLLIKKITTGMQHAQHLAVLTILWLTFAPGMIQFAHFTTFEMFLTLEYLLLIWVSYSIATDPHPSYRKYILAGIITGLSVGTKITSLVVAPVLLFAHIINLYQSTPRPHWHKYLFNPKLMVLAVSMITATLLTSPFHLLDLHGFIGSMNYESGVARGTLPVFYTQQFIETIPGWYQLTRVFPYIMTIPLTLLSLISLIYFIWQLSLRSFHKLKLRKKFGHREILLLLLTSFTILYLSFHLSLYVKWTRYMIPLIPVLVVLSCAFVARLSQLKPLRLITELTVATITIVIIGQGLLFWQIYLLPDSRVQAAEWSGHNLKLDHIASEIYDMGIVPFNQYIDPQNITLLPLYDAEDPTVASKITPIWQTSKAFISPSQRIWSTRMRLPNKFPTANHIYSTMFNNLNGWHEVLQISRTEIDCSIWTLYCGNGRLLPDETFAVFDHPTITIWRHYAY